MTLNIATWLIEGERGLSSEAIARTALSGRPSGFREAWPYDPSDLRRCLLLLEQAPEAREAGLVVLARRWPEWAALVNVWDDLSETLRSEIGETLPLRGSAPKTYASMKEVLNSAHSD